VENREAKQLVRFWKEASIRDLDAARDIFEKTKNYVTVLFYIHLAIEKILKALYV